MRIHSVFTIAWVVLLSVGTAGLRAETICEVQAYDPATGLSPLNGQTVTVTGIATVPTGVFQPTQTSIYIRGISGDDCGVNVFSRVRVQDIGLGDTVVVTGLVQEYISTTGKGASTEITFAAASDITSRRRGSTVPPPQPLDLPTGAVAREINEGKFVRVTGKVASTVGPRSFFVDDGSGQIEIFDLSQNFAGDPVWKSLAYAEDVTVTGVVSQSIAGPPFLGGYSLVPRSPAFGDVAPPNCRPDTISTAAFLVMGSRLFSPEMGQQTFIRYKGPHTVRVVFRVFDVDGRTVANFDNPVDLVGAPDVVPTGASALCSTIPWDGRNELREALPMGLYIIEITAEDIKTHETIKKMEPVVIGRRLR